MTISKAEESFDITKILEGLPSSDPDDEFDVDAFFGSWGNETENRELEERRSIPPAIERDTPPLDIEDFKRIKVYFLVELSQNMSDKDRTLVGRLIDAISREMEGYFAHYDRTYCLSLYPFGDMLPERIEDVMGEEPRPELVLCDGDASLGLALEHLGERLGYWYYDSDNLIEADYAPWIFLISSGSCDADTAVRLATLNENGAFMVAKRFALILGEGADFDPSLFAGDDNCYCRLLASSDPIEVVRSRLSRNLGRRIKKKEESSLGFFDGWD